MAFSGADANREIGGPGEGKRLIFGSVLIGMREHARRPRKASTQVRPGRQRYDSLGGWSGWIEFFRPWRDFIRFCGAFPSTEVLGYFRGRGDAAYFKFGHYLGLVFVSALRPERPITRSLNLPGADIQLRLADL